MCCDKSALRRQMLKMRKAAPRENGEKIAARIRDLPEFCRAERVMLYMPIKGEADVTELLRDNKEFFFPVTEGEEIYASPMTGEFTAGAFGVAEPVGRERFDGQIDIVIVPGVAFGRDGGRVGYGKGYYDRFLQGASALKIGVCHDFQLVEAIDGEAHDVKMDLIITQGETLWIKDNTSSR